MAPKRGGSFPKGFRVKDTPRGAELLRVRLADALFLTRGLQGTSAGSGRVQSKKGEVGELEARRPGLFSGSQDAHAPVYV